MTSRKNISGATISLCIILSSFAYLGPASAESGGGTRFYTDCNDSMIALFHMTPDRGSVGTEVSFTVHTLDSGEYIRPDNVTLKKVYWVNVPTPGKMLVYMGLREGPKGIFTATYSVTAQDLNGELYFEIEARWGKNYDSERRYFSWDGNPDAGTQAEEPRERHVSILMDEYGPSPPGDTRGFYVQMYEIAGGAPSPVDTTAAPRCWYVTHPSDESYEYLPGDSSGQEDRVDISLVSSSAGEWMGEVPAPVNITESATFEIVAATTYNRGGVTTEAWDQVNFTVDLYDLWYHNLTVGNKGAKFELCVLEDGEPVPGARVTCRVQKAGFNGPGEKDRVEKLTASITDPLGRVFFSVGFNKNTHALYTTGWVSAEECRQHYKGCIGTPNPMVPEAEEEEEEEETDPYAPTGQYLEVILQHGNDVVQGESSSLDYRVWYTQGGGNVEGEEPETLGNTQLYYYLVCWDHEGDIIGSGAVTTDGQGRFELTVPVPELEALGGPGARILCVFEAPITEAEGDTSDDMAYSSDSSSLAVVGSTDREDDGFGFDETLVLNVPPLAAGGEATATILFNRADSDYGYNLSWSVVTDPGGDPEDWLGGGLELTYDKWSSCSHGGMATTEAGYFMGTSAAVDFAVPPFVGDDQQILFIVSAGDPLGDDLAINYALVDVVLGNDSREMTYLGPFMTYDGEPVEGATVSVTDKMGETTKALTDEYGFARLEGRLDIGAFEARVDKGGKEVVPDFGFSVDDRGRAVYDAGTTPPTSLLTSRDLPAGSDSLEPEAKQAEEGDGILLTVLIVAVVIAAAASAAGVAAAVRWKMVRKKREEDAALAPRPLVGPGPRPLTGQNGGFPPAGGAGTAAAPPHPPAGGGNVPGQGPPPPPVAGPAPPGPDHQYDGAWDGYHSGTQNGYQTGYHSGTQNGYQTGYHSGTQNGYQTGYHSGTQNGQYGGGQHGPHEYGPQVQQDPPGQWGGEPYPGGEGISSIQQGRDMTGWGQPGGEAGGVTGKQSLGQGTPLTPPPAPPGQSATTPGPSPTMPGPPPTPPGPPSPGTAFRMRPPSDISGPARHDPGGRMEPLDAGDEPHPRMTAPRGDVSYQQQGDGRVYPQS